MIILRANRLKALPWLIHGFSTRCGGSSRGYGGHALNLGFTRDDKHSVVTRNRNRFLACLTGGKTPGTLVTLRQVHSDLIHRVDTPPGHPLMGDGLLTASPGLLLAVQTADCLPVILVDARRRAVGVFHAGWRGTVQRIVEKAVGEMLRRFGSRPWDLRAAIGPGIHSCCYEVGEEVRQEFESQFAYASTLFREIRDVDPVRRKYPLLFLSARPPGHSRPTVKLLFDLVEANRRQLLATGVPARSIEAIPLCTACHTDLLFSYRAQQGMTGRLMGVVGIR
ncbi:MAG TPA: peptidoglycan editing factor PgeF [Terriglobales bacterium]|nr:peptidoglycan editing factor PgeF [Terriglobales bacterium]